MTQLLSTQLLVATGLLAIPLNHESVIGCVSPSVVGLLGYFCHALAIAVSGCFLATCDLLTVLHVSLFAD